MAQSPSVPSRAQPHLHPLLHSLQDLTLEQFGQLAWQLHQQGPGAGAGTAEQRQQQQQEQQDGEEQPAV